jgi:hypothetical protein
MRLILFYLLFAPVFIYAQLESISIDNSVYSFLRQMKIQNIISEYNDNKIPLSREDILKYLSAIEINKDKLSSHELDFFYKLKDKFNLETAPEELLKDLPETFFNKIISSNNKDFFFYKDSIFNLKANPFFGLEYIYSSQNKNNANLYYIGGDVTVNYKGWLGFYIQGSNGMVSGNRETALIEKIIKQSFTFNHTKINYFDNTEGYLIIKNDLFKIELGRERFQFGNGLINKFIISDNTQPFDFISFDLQYKFFTYNYFHGSLVQKPIIYSTDTISGTGAIEYLPFSKYIAFSRFGVNIDNFNCGIGQIIIYSKRPFDLAYLNPFLFWESAQRSLNDLDNSFLSFDLTYSLISGAELNGSLMLDDFNFSKLVKNWDNIQNRYAFTSGVGLTYPLLPRNMFFAFEYNQVRPYMYSHPGGGESLTYTNNGYLLGLPILPNSIQLNFQLSYKFSKNLDMRLDYFYNLHGNNITDSLGNVLKNVGGDVLKNINWFSSPIAPLLDGELVKTQSLSLNIAFEPIYYLYLNLIYNILSSNTSHLDHLVKCSFLYNIE